MALSSIAAGHFCQAVQRINDTGAMVSIRNSIYAQCPSGLKLPASFAYSEIMIRIDRANLN